MAEKNRLNSKMVLSNLFFICYNMVLKEKICQMILNDGGTQLKQDTLIVNHSTDEGLRQKEFIQKVRKVNEQFEKKHGRKKKMHITTFGCQMNFHDSEKLKGVLIEMGYEETDREDDADFIAYNTCAVRENAETRVYGRIGHLKTLKKRNKNLMIALCGCMMQQDTVIQKLKQSYPHVDIVFGTHNIYKMAELIDTRMETGQQIFDIWDSYKDIVEDLPTIRKEKFKASVNIIFGCNNFCSYCIVPYVRGRERSRKSADILEEIKILAKDGVIEITLLGQNVNSYGKDMDCELSFPQLLQEIVKIEGIERVRFMTSHPKDLSDELIEVIKNEKKVCNSIHLPFQTGSTRLLQEMNRRYTKESYLELVRKMKEAVPNVALTTDIIVGYPGETEEDFMDTLEVVQQVEYDSAFTFIYSKRTGTPAAIKEDQVPEEVTKERFDRLLKLVNEHAYKKSKEHVGKTYDVLVESINEKGEVSGRLENGHLVHLEGTKELIGTMIPVYITKAMSFYLLGKKA